MPLYVGHYLGNPKEWFLAWGRDKMEAAEYVDCAMGEPDLRSMRRVRGPGFVGFRARVKKEESIAEGEGHFDVHVLALNRDEIDLGTGEGYEENNDWIVKRIRKPLGPLKEREISEAGRRLGVAQPKLLRALVGEENSPPEDPRLRR